MVSPGFWEIHDTQEARAAEQTAAHNAWQRQFDARQQAEDAFNRHAQETFERDCVAIAEVALGRVAPNFIIIPTVSRPRWSRRRQPEPTGDVKFAGWRILDQYTPSEETVDSSDVGNPSTWTSDSSTGLVLSTDKQLYRYGHSGPPDTPVLPGASLTPYDRGEFGLEHNWHLQYRLAHEMRYPERRLEHYADYWKTLTRYLHGFAERNHLLDRLRRPPEHYPIHWLED